MLLAQAMLEKGALDSLSLTFASIRYEFVSAVEDGRILWVVGVALVLWFLWHSGRSGGDR